MGIGAAWFEQEHTAYGIPFYTTAERIHRLEEAVEIIKRLWTERQATFEGRHYRIKDAYCEPKPVRKPYPPIMIGGSGEKLMLRVIAKHADIRNTFGSPELFRHKIEVLRGHCDAVGRNFDDIEISWAGLTLLTESSAEKDAAVGAMAQAFGQPVEQVEPGLLVGSADEVRDRIERLVAVGVTHFIILASAPFNHDSIRRFAEEVIPAFRKG
jgi:alkanesulfonate monooxygenase SsuD/methylene tetrahydromethanopterin reductase-like flavin-dependent oxidoreductase (luciferase family)